MGRKQQALGLDRLPLSNGGLAAWAFRTGEPYRTGHAELDPEELRAVVEELGVRSELLVPLACAAGRRACSRWCRPSPTASTTRTPRSPRRPRAGWG